MLLSLCFEGSTKIFLGSGGGTPWENFAILGVKMKIFTFFILFLEVRGRSPWEIFAILGVKTKIFTFFILFSGGPGAEPPGKF